MNSKNDGVAYYNGPIAGDGYPDGMSLYAGYFSAFQALDPFGLEWILRCERCWKLDEECCEVRTGAWRFECGLVNLSTGDAHVSWANDYEPDEGGNSDSTDPGDFYGPNGPLEPGEYEVTNEDMGRYRNGGGSYLNGNDGRTPVVSNDGNGGVVTSSGNARSGIMIHPQGSYSNGCITTTDSFAQDVEDAVEDNGGSMRLVIVDNGDACPCP